MLRARLSLFALEGRENPSVPGADPIGLPGPAPVTDPVVVQPAAPVLTTIITIGGGIAGGAADPAPAAPPTPTSSLGGTDPLFLIPAP